MSIILENFYFAVWFHQLKFSITKLITHITTLEQKTLCLGLIFIIDI